jgi:hypothetical protein
MRPFASQFYHGAALLSTHSYDTVPFFMIELVHQFGHNMLNAVLFEQMRYFKVDPFKLLKDFNQNPNEGRTLLSAFHGLFTTLKVGECTEVMLNTEGVFSEEERYELVGRIVDNRRRFRTGLDRIDLKSVFTKEGLALYEEMDTACYDLYQRNKDLCDQYDISNQPFVFSYEKFKELNPMNVIA